MFVDPGSQVQERESGIRLTLTNITNAPWFGAFIRYHYFLDRLVVERFAADFLEVDLFAVVLFAVVLRVVERVDVVRFLVAAPFFAAEDLLAAFRLRVAAPFFAAADREREVAVGFFAAVVRLRVAVDLFAVDRVDLFAVDRDEVEREAVDFFAAPPFIPPRFDGVVSFFLPRPDPLFLPPPSCAFTVA